MARISLSGKQKSIEKIWSWYEDQKVAINDFKLKTLNSGNNPSFYESKFYSFSKNDIMQYFAESEVELEHIVCFELIAATEALLRIDFIKKVYNKDRSAIGRRFRKIYKTKERKISLEEDIVETWKETFTSNNKEMSDFLGLLKYRNWLAHGRFWEPKLGRKYSSYLTYEIVDNVIKIIQG